jgi:hypothetical protein
MSRAIQHATACREALARLPKLDLGELRQRWRALNKADASPHLSRELLVRAVAYRMQEAALGGLRPQGQRQLRQIPQQLDQTAEIRRRGRLELKSGTRLVREWRGRTYEVLMLDAAIEALPDSDRQCDTKGPSKQAAVIAMLQQPEGATVEEVSSAMGWQRHTVRGLFSGTLKKKLGLALASAKEERGRVYRIAEPASA